MAYEDLLVTQPVQGDGEPISADWVAQVRDNFEALRNPPRCELVCSGQVITAAEVIDWTSEDLDTASMWTSGSTITPTVAGRYYVIAVLVWNSAGDTTLRQAVIRKNGASTAWQDGRAAINGAQTVQEVSGEVSCNGTTDTISVTAGESAAGDVTLSSARIVVRWVAPS